MLDSDFNDFVVSGEQKIENICIVKITTDFWSDNKGLYLKKSIRFLRRKCKGFNILEEDCSQIGADWVINNIVNLDKVKDGIYMVNTINEYRDWETGYIEGYDYSLEEIKE